MTTANRFVLPYQTVIDNIGVPLPNAQLFFYQSGTSTPANTYADAALTTPNTNPVVASPAGVFPNIFLSAILYKVVLEDMNGNQIWTADPVSGIGGGGSSSIITPSTVPSAATVDLGSLNPNVIITGNVNISSFGSSGSVGQTSTIQFTGLLKIIFNSTSMQLPNNSQGLAILPGDIIQVICTGLGNWKVFDYSPYSVWAITQNPANNTPYLPWNFMLGNDAGTLYPDAGMIGAYSAPHFSMKSLIIGNAGSFSTLWAWSDAGTPSAPTPQTVPVEQLQILIWGLDNTGARVASPSVGPGQSAYQGRQAQIQLNQYGSQTQTSRPGSMNFGVGRDNWQVPVDAMWLDKKGGMVLQGQAVNSAVTAATIAYPWASAVDDYSPVPNLNWMQYTSDATITTIASDSSQGNIWSIYRWDDIASGPTNVGFRWDYFFSTNIMRLSAINGGSGTPVIAFGPDGTTYVSGPFLPFPASSGGAIGTLAAPFTSAVIDTISTSAPSVQTGSTYAVGTTDDSIVFNSSGTVTVTLPSAATYSGRWLHMKTIANFAINSATSNVKPITTNTAGTAILTNTAGKWAALQSDGTNWVVMMAN